MKPDHSPHSAPSLTTGLRVSALGRRISASDSVTALLASIAFGEPRRSDLAALASATAARCSSYAEGR